jgi:hypothetical protein
MYRYYAAILFFALLGFYSCSSEEEHMEQKVSYSVNIIQKLDLAIPSGSGITGYKKGFLTVGDDTPWLYYLDSTGVLTDSMRISNVEGYVPGVRMDGSFKPDFECLTRLNDHIVLIMSSGSYNAARDTAYLVNAFEHRILAKKSLAPLFESFAEKSGIEDVHSLNFEGVAVAHHDIYFFNRGDLSGRDLVFKADLAQFISYFTEGDSVIITGMYEPTPHNEAYGNSTYSACVYLPDVDVFIFTSTSEDGSRIDSTGKVVDGEIRGSFIGRIRMDEFNHKQVKAYPIMENDSLAPIKVEGIWLHSIVGDSIAHFIGVSDPDNGTTDTYIIEVKIKQLD